MARQYRIVSGDAHLELDPERWTGRVPAKWRERAPRRITLPDGGDGVLVENRPLYVLGIAIAGAPPPEHKIFGVAYEGSPGAGSLEQRLQEQDVDGVDAEILFTAVSGFQLWRGISDDEAFNAVIHAYNTFLAEEYCAPDRDRLIALGVIPDTGIDDAIAEMEYCARAGLRGIALYSFPNGKSCPTPEDDRFWAAALDLNMPVSAHVSFADKPGPKFRYQRAPAGLASSADPVGRMTRFSQGGGNMLQLIMAGVFDRFPDLQIYWAETQIGWVPHFFSQTDDNYERCRYWAERHFGLQPLRRPPSEYLKEHTYWGFVYDPLGVKLRDYVGVDRAMWGADFPHAAGDWPESRRVLDEMFAGVPDDDRYKMTCGNAVDFFHLDNTAQPSEAVAARTST